MKKTSNKKSSTGNWEGIYLFVGYVDEQVGVGQDDDKKKCIIKGKDEQQCECPRRDLQMY
jgi:hypothetical protein